MKIRFLSFLPLLLLVGCLPDADLETDDAPVVAVAETREPEGAVGGLDVGDDLEVTLFAYEPDVVNPTNIDIDERGRVWVTEGINYRPNRNPNNPTVPEGDRIVILEDTDGDGVSDLRKVFYQGEDINSALGIAVFGERVIVSAYNNVFIFTDEDGDDQADTKEVFFTGIKGEHHDHSVHAFVFGPDGKLYFNFGNAGEQLLDADGNPVIDKAGNVVNDEGNPYRQGMVFRLNPDGSELEVLGHNFRNNYEVALDSYGTLWQSDNDDDGNRATRINFVMEFGNYGFTDEMTGAGWRERRTGMHEEIPLRHWHLNDPGVVPNLLQTGAGSPTGITVYEGDLLPERFHNEMIHTDAGPRVVRAYPVENDGAGYSAEIDNIIQGTHDQWFRPSDVAVAPDGSLIVADWYDPGVGGHQVGDLERGRLFRVAPPDTPYRVPEFDVSTPEGAVEALKSPNMTTRYLAWNALHEAGPEAEAALQTLWNDENPRFRARALWVLSKLEGRGLEYIEQALSDNDPNIRITGIRAGRQVGMELIPHLQDLADDPSPQVRREVLIALRHDDAPEAADLWTDLALQYDGNDRWYLEALGIAADGQWDRFFDTWIAQVGEPDTKAERDIVWRARTPAALPYLAEFIKDPGTDERDRLRYFRAFDFHTDASKNGLLAGLLDTGGDHPNRDAIAHVALRHIDTDYLQRLPTYRQVLSSALASVSGTLEYIDLVQRFDLREEAPALVDLALTYPDSSLGAEAGRTALAFGGQRLFAEAVADEARKRDAVAVMSTMGDDASALLEDVMMDTTETMELRTLAMQGYGQGWRGENRLLEALDNGTVPEDLRSAAASKLLTAYRENIRAGAMKHLEADADTTMPSVAQLVEQTGDVQQGMMVYEQQCSICHVVDGQGIEFGPALSEIGDKLSDEAMYVSILQPSAGISFGYEAVLVTLNDGNQALGYISSETEDTITLKMPGGVTQNYDKREIASREVQDASLMTPNLHLVMSEQDLVNLVAYLKSLRRPTS